MLELFKQPWHWSVAGLIIGLIVPTLLLIGNKHFGVSSSFRHVCAACFPANIPFFKYDWKKEAWNLFFVGGIAAGAFLSVTFLQNPAEIQVHAGLAGDLSNYGVQAGAGLSPDDLFSFESLLSLRGFILIVLGGLLVGFGARYAGGCTSGHAIMGLSNLQWPSLIAVFSFMAGGFITANFLLPVILKL